MIIQWKYQTSFLQAVADIRSSLLQVAGVSSPEWSAVLLQVHSHSISQLILAKERQTAQKFFFSPGQRHVRCWSCSSDVEPTRRCEGSGLGQRRLWTEDGSDLWGALSRKRWRNILLRLPGFPVIFGSRQRQGRWERTRFAGRNLPSCPSERQVSKVLDLRSGVHSRGNRALWDQLWCYEPAGKGKIFIVKILEAPQFLQIGALVRSLQPKAQYFVDAMSSFGAVPLNLEHVDWVVSSANKCLQVW